ncbi:MAG: aminopeptidase P N-terminal domain-containing protein [Synergistaceae bacterium]|jgi:Xaa-Pro aminopeptidase|nr:aminopeptidase P N-terminal domain-containing protein [Synergistaceae bacterium]
MTKDFFKVNRRRLLEELPEGSLAVFFAGAKQYRSNDSMYRFTPDRNYYYLTGLAYPDGVLLLGKEAGGTFEIAFIDRPAPEVEKLWGPTPTAEESVELTGIEEVRYLDRLDGTLSLLLHRRDFAYIYADEGKMALGGLTEADLFLERLRRSYAWLQVRNGRRVVGNLRRVKTPEEIDCLRIAARETVAGMAELIGKIKPGVHTYELRAEFEYYMTRNGMEGSVFLPVITTGPSIRYLHYVPDERLRDGELVLVDLGAEYRYYGADICRMYPVNGKFSPVQKIWYEAVRDVLLEMEAALRPGPTLQYIETLGRKLLADRLKANKKIEADWELSKYLPHGITHFLGLDNHDIGEDCPLAPGMLLAAEPGLYFTDFGSDLNFGVRVEDSILITENGSEVLTKDLSLDAGEIERVMGERTAR